MSITNYTELKASVASWLHRTDLTAQIVDFITLAESRINRKLNLLLQETEATLTATPSSRLIAVPTRFDRAIALWLTTWQPRQELEYRLPSQLPVTNFNGFSSFYTVSGSNIETENPADQAYTYNLRYFIDFDIAATSTNLLLTSYPDIYLYGALLESAPYMRNSNDLQMWQNRFDLACKEASVESASHKAKASLRTDLPGTTRGGNILRGY